MKIFELISVAAIGFIGLGPIVSCSSVDDTIEDLQPVQDVAELHTCKMILNGTKSDYSDTQRSRADLEWNEGDKIYLTFTTATGTTYGDASYSSGSWNVSYYGTLSDSTYTQCTAVYFDNAKYASGTVVQINECTGIYEDTDGKYLYADGTLSVTATLTPKLGRIRFAGEVNDTITVCGISHYTSYDISTGKFIQTKTALKEAVDSLYTPYIYGEFTDSVQPRLNIITPASGFTRMPSSSVMKKGQSGYMSIPTESSHNGWLNSVILKVDSVEFTMIPVEYSEGNFLLAETELTRELYVAIVGSGYNSDLQRPADEYYSTYSTLLSKLSSIIGLNFRFPTYNEWKYAAKGGNKSQSYTYSGSNNIDDVAWYSGNSNNSLHYVKQLQPNELGFYDMCGNVGEFILYNSGPGSYNIMGGSYNSSEGDCKVTSYLSSNYGSSYAGLRIALSNTNK
jgi:hypothetical protein